MKNKRKKLNFILLLMSLFSFLILNSCGQLVKLSAKKWASEEKGAIPPDFGKNNETLLIIKEEGSKSYYKRTEKDLKKYYSGPYVIISKKEFQENEKYKDIAKYRYIYQYTYKSVTQTDPNKSNEINNVSYHVKRFSILDRKDNKLYKCGMTSSYWSKIQSSYLKNLNKKYLSSK